MATRPRDRPPHHGAAVGSEYDALLTGRVPSVRRRCALHAAALMSAAGGGSAAIAAAFLDRIAAAVENNIDGIYAAAALVTIASLTVSPSTYFLKKRYDRRAERRQATTNVWLELEYDLKSLDRATFGRDLVSVDVEGSVARFMNRDLNHDIYDSLASSGNLNFLEPGLQQMVQFVFRMIKMHNVYTDIVTRELSRGGECTKDMASMCKWLEWSEAVMRDNIPELMESLKKSLWA